MTPLNILHILILIPFVGFVLSLLVPHKNEKWIARVAVITIGIHLLGFLALVVYWLLHHHISFDFKDLIFYQTNDYEFYIDICFDKISAVYLLVGSFLAFLVTIYSRTYLHRERGYKRFFNTILFFYIAYNITVLAGNFETLFIGWEMLGISSFLLIAFYRDRYLPVKNAIKVFSIYRIGDIGLILAMWASHHLWHENITFSKLNNFELVHEHLQSHSWVGVFISFMILVAAAAKSAQLPFTSWLPRAMEGPTPSSAIFYGSLSVHFGVFLLLRTFPFWEQQVSIRILIGLVGLTTSIAATLIARVQSSVKSQIAYASAAQIGLIFIEVAFGFENLALFHFAGNAFLRTYQLLVSPSVVTYLIREQFYNFVPRRKTIEDSLPKRIEYSFYLLSLKEWNLDEFMNRMLWKPLKKTGRAFNFISVHHLLLFFVPTYFIGIGCLQYESFIPKSIYELLPALFAFIGLIMVFKSFVERKNVIVSWLLVVTNHFWIVLAVSFNEHFKLEEILIYLSGVLVSGSIGYFALVTIKSHERHVDLNQYHGHSYEHPRIAFLFLLACLGLTGFPITPTFIGEDLIFTHIHEDQFILAFFIASSFVIDGLALVRIYARIFLGPHEKSYHEIPYKSS
jgi:NADH-quinone oxidoreductase subunit L